MTLCFPKSSAAEHMNASSGTEELNSEKLHLTIMVTL